MVAKPRTSFRRGRREITSHLTSTELDTQGVNGEAEDGLEKKENNLTESSRDTNDETLALEDLGDGDLVAGRVLHQLNVRNRVADLDHDGR